MARNHWGWASEVEMALTAATRTAVMRLNAPTNIIEALQGVDITFDGTKSTDDPVIIELLRVTTDGTMTAQTPKRIKETGITLGITGARGPASAGSLPTAGDVLKVFHIHPQAGVVYPLALPDGEVEFANGGRIAIFVTAPQAVNCLVSSSGEE